MKFLRIAAACLLLLSSATLSQAIWPFNHKKPAPATRPQPQPRLAKADKPTKLRHLEGTIVDEKNFPIEYAVVEIHDPTDHHMLATTFADANGKFAFADKKRGTHLDFRITSKGYQPIEFKAVVGRFGKMHVWVRLPKAS